MAETPEAFPSKAARKVSVGVGEGKGPQPTAYGRRGSAMCQLTSGLVPRVGAPGPTCRLSHGRGLAGCPPP